MRGFGPTLQDYSLLRGGLKTRKNSTGIPTDSLVSFRGAGRFQAYMFARAPEGRSARAVPVRISPWIEEVIP